VSTLSLRDGSSVFVLHSSLFSDASLAPTLSLLGIRLRICLFHSLDRISVLWKWKLGLAIRCSLRFRERSKRLWVIERSEDLVMFLVSFLDLVAKMASELIFDLVLGTSSLPSGASVCLNHGLAVDAHSIEH
jgi:hypothetical protein